jgi:DNA-binding IclR family transcriptional regulator
VRTQERGDRRREAIVAFIRRRHDEGHAATIRDIAAHVGTSPSTVHRHVRVLAEQGLVTYRPNEARSIRPIQPRQEAGS